MTAIKEMLAPRGSAARPGYTLTPQYITIHNTANASRGAGAESHGKYLQGAGCRQTVSYHYAVDDGLIVRIIPDKEVAWHAGDGVNGPGNRKSLAIEICENPESNLAKATDNAAELTARLMHSYGIPLTNVVQHNHWSGKNCPHLLRAGKPYTWGTFLQKVQGFYDAQAKPATQYIIQAGAFASRTAAQEYLAKLTAAGFPAFIREVQSNGN